MFEYYNTMYNTFKLLSKNNLAIAVALNNGDLTAEQYKTITGEDYTPPVITSVVKDLQVAITKNMIRSNLSGGLVTDRMGYIEADVEVLKAGGNS